MDEAVARALTRWPDVPSVYGWLRLTRRGEWRIKDDPIANASVSAFIGRNYAHDPRGRWFFQNGPQRVFVTIEYTPLVYRAEPAGFTAAPFGVGAQRVDGAWMDDGGSLLLLTEHGVGVVADRDLHHVLAQIIGPAGAPADDEELAAALAAARVGGDTGLRLRAGAAPVPIAGIVAAEVPRRFGFDPDPRPAPGEPAC
jgi:hypothetical protein